MPDSPSCCVYKHTTPDGKVYIGRTTRRVEERWAGGSGYRSNTAFHAVIQAYGWHNIAHEVLATGLTPEEAAEEEIRLISEYRSTDPRFGFNHATGGLTNRGYRLTATRREAIREFAKSRHVSAATREKLRTANLGRKHTEEAKAKMREAKLGKPLSAETRQKMKISNLGKRDKPVRCVELGRVFCSLTEAERVLGIPHENIAKVCRGKRKTAGGYRWEYENDG